jgi:hypothetical protein
VTKEAELGASRREPLTAPDLMRPAALAAGTGERHALFAAVDRLVQRAIGHRLFTIMRVHETAREVERSCFVFRPLRSMMERGSCA